MVTPGLQLKVLAQDGVTKCVYSVELDKTAHPAIYSTVYSIDQSSKIVNFINGTSVKVFLHNLTTNAGNSIRVYDYENNLRSMGSLKYDDRLYAVSADGKDSVLYLMKFTDETGAGSGVENAIKKTNALEVKCRITSYNVCYTKLLRIAAVLLLKGLSPGAALVFLMAGPATNAATITVLKKALVV